jgi:hypothetical protein
VRRVSGQLSHRGARSGAAFITSRTRSVDAQQPAAFARGVPAIALLTGRGAWLGREHSEAARPTAEHALLLGAQWRVGAVG